MQRQEAVGTGKDCQEGVLLISIAMQSKEFAAVWIWKLGTWSPVQQLECHTLTVTQLAFSPSGAYLVSVSRDRSLAIWKRNSGIYTILREYEGL